jgi:hypothetical protein
MENGLPFYGCGHMNSSDSQFMCQLVLLIAEAAKEHLPNILHFTADFVFTLCYDLDCHDLHQAGKRSTK